MTTSYAEYSISELRVMLLNDALEHEYLDEGSYSALIENEMKMPEPLDVVIDFCIEGLGKYEEYQELNKINIDIKNLIESVECEQQKNKMISLKRLPIIAAITISIILLSQIVSLAFEFDLLGYIFKWDKEVLEIDIPDNNYISEEPIYTEYEKVEDIPNNIKNAIPSLIWKRFDFAHGSNLIHGETYSIALYFNNADNVTILATITKSKEQTIEKDDNYLEKYQKGEISYSIFKNLDYYVAVWIDGGLLYNISANLPLDDFKEVVNSFST